MMATALKPFEVRVFLFKFSISHFPFPIEYFMDYLRHVGALYELICYSANILPSTVHTFTAGIIL